jgi:peptidoglycan/LPS O-acetylase OafA/YrhL
MTTVTEAVDGVRSAGAPASRTSTRLDSLTGLRALAALAVFGFHAAVLPQTAHLVGQGGVGVSFFYVLSGFVLMWAGGGRVPALTFYRRRFARIYPSFLVAWIAGIAVMLIAEHVTPNPGQVGVGLLLLQSWVPDQSWSFAINGVSWSLSCEAFFYLTFPLWAGALLAARGRQRGIVIAACLAGTFITAAVSQMLDPGGVADPPTNLWSWYVVGGLPTVRILEFILGACLAAELRQGRSWNIGLLPASALAAAAYLLSGFWATRFCGIFVTLVPFLLLIAAAAGADLSDRRSVFANRLMVWAGQISFCFYLVHQLVIRVVAPRMHSGVARIPIELLVSVGAAAALHYTVERPLERRIRGRRSPARGAPSHAEVQLSAAGRPASAA